MNDQPSPAEPNDLASQLVELENKLTFQQRAFEELNGVVLEQQGEIESLRREAQSLRQLLQGLTDRGMGEDLPHEKPPHY